MNMGKFVKFAILIVAFEFIFFWNLFPWAHTEEYVDPAYTECINCLNKIGYNLAKKMREELHLMHNGLRDRKHEKFEELGMQFTAYHRANIEEARAMHLYILNHLIDAINNEEKIRPFLEQYPVDDNNITVSISFDGNYGRQCSGVGSIFNVGLTSVEENKNKIFYSYTDPFTGNIIDLFDETYDEALERVKDFSTEDLAVHHYSPLEEAIDEVLDGYAQEMYREKRLRCEHIGGKESDNLEGVGVSFRADQRAEQSEARKLALEATERLLSRINGHEQLRPYLAEYPFTVDKIKLRISFVQYNGCPYRDGSMHSVTVEGDKVTYFQEPPEDSNVTPAQAPVYAVESYQKISRSRKL